MDNKSVEKCRNKGDDFLSIIKKLTRVIVALILVCIIGVLILASPWILIFIGGWLSPNPPAPEITYGEFPFRLEYRIEDEVYVVEDVIVCEYDGVDWNEGVGKHRIWKGTFKNTGEEELLVLTDGDTKIYCSVGGADYYMGDKEYGEPYVPKFYYVTSFENGTVSGGADDLLDKYKIELLDWQLSEPIENKFE